MSNDTEKHDETGSAVRLIGLSGAYKGNEYLLTGSEFMIGRAKDCNLVLDESTVSAKHAKITKIGDNYEIMDLNSTNGTFVNGVKVERKGLRTNDKIKMDVFEFRYINPAEVERTVVSEAPDFAAAQKTVVREEAIKPEAPPPPRVHAAPPPPQARPVEAPVHARVSSGGFEKGGSIIVGLIVGLIIAYIFSFGGSIAGTWSMLDFNMNAVQNLLVDGLKTFPFFHMHSTFLPWQTETRVMIAAIVMIVSVVLGLLLGGVITQSIGRKNRFLTAIVFTIFYVGIALAVQFGMLNFNFQQWQSALAMGARLGITDNLLHMLAAIGYVTGVTFVISFIGTLLGRK